MRPIQPKTMRHGCVAQNRVQRARPPVDRRSWAKRRSGSISVCIGSCLMLGHVCLPVPLALSHIRPTEGSGIIGRACHGTTEVRSAAQRARRMASLHCSPSGSGAIQKLIRNDLVGYARHGHRKVLHRLRSPRPRASARALGRDPRTPSNGRDGPAHESRSSKPGRSGTDLPAVATSSWTGAALAALEFFEVRGQTVLCPSNTFMATPLAIVAAGRAGRVRRLQPRRPLHVVRGLRAQGRSAHRPRAVVPRPHRRPHRLRRRADRRALPGRGDRAARGLRARARRLVERPAGRHLGRCRHLVVRRDEDDLDRRGRHGRLARTPS